MDRRTDQQTYLPVEMQFYISVMFLDLPDDIHEEKPSFLQFKKKLITDGPRDRPTDGQTLSYRCEDASKNLTEPRRARTSIVLKLLLCWGSRRCYISLKTSLKSPVSHILGPWGVGRRPRYLTITSYQLPTNKLATSTMF